HSASLTKPQASKEEKRVIALKLLKLYVTRNWKVLFLSAVFWVVVITTYFKWDYLYSSVTGTFQIEWFSFKGWLPTTLGANYLLIVLIAATVGVACFPFLSDGPI